ncbi:MAG: copper-translocating P-type ATPase [Chloroflexi bacterium]|nr:copper-translocating P-type ATPase [Chloroflexota bacterium]
MDEHKHHDHSEMGMSNHDGHDEMNHVHHEHHASSSTEVVDHSHGEREDDMHMNHQVDQHERHADEGAHTSHAGHVDHSDHELMFRNRFWISLLLSIPVLLYSPIIQGWLKFSMNEFPGSEWITPVFAIIIFGIGGIPFLQMAVPELKNRLPGMMTLISLAISVSLVYSVVALAFDLGEGFFWELVTLIDVMLLGHWIEMRSVRQASGALNELAKLMPDIAERILSDGETETIPLSSLKSNDLVLVRPGASIPADGKVEAGESDVNESMITGESKHVKKEIGSRVIAGTINAQGSLRIRVEATGEATALAGIMRLVAEAQSSKSNTQVLADKAAAWLFYIAVVAAVLTGLGWGLSIGLGLYTLQRVVTVLVIACPHALGLAVPLVVAISTSSAAKNGILVRDRLALEVARNIDVVIFDKTGTLTKGEQGVSSMAVAKGWSEDDALAMTAAVEGDSEHIIAQAIRQAAEDRKLTIPKVTDFEAIKGRGVRANFDDHEIHVGGPRLLELLNLEPASPLAQFTKEAGEKGQSVINLIQDGEVVAAFALSDIIRPESILVVQQLQKMGVQVAMLTGDSQAVAKSVADELGIDMYFAEVLPENKDQQVVDLQAQGKKVAMVGDGVNDAPALARADVGIAIGSGTDVAVESAGIILINSNPLDVVKIFLLSRASYRKMIQNLVWATGYNLVAIPLAAGVLAFQNILLTPAIGALFMSLSTIIVAINAQFLRREKLVIN